MPLAPDARKQPFTSVHILGATSPRLRASHLEGDRAVAKRCLVVGEGAGVIPGRTVAACPRPLRSTLQAFERKTKTRRDPVTLGAHSFPRLQQSDGRLATPLS